MVLERGGGVYFFLLLLLFLQEKLVALNWIGISKHRAYGCHGTRSGIGLGKMVGRTGEGEREAFEGL